MSSPELQPIPPKPSAPPALQWLMRVTGIVALLLFLTPTMYVVKYYAVDLPREKALTGPHVLEALQAGDPDALYYFTAQARQASDPVTRWSDIRGIGSLLRQPGIGWKRPLECLSAKATLAELATKDADPTVRAAASAELSQVAQTGAVIQR